MEQSSSMFVPLVFLGIFLLTMAGYWKIFTKAGKPGWATLVPIYNFIVMLQIARRPMWWLILMFIPIVNFFVVLVVTLDIAKAFGRGTGFGLGMVFLGPIFFPILGFGGSRYARIQDS